MATPIEQAGALPPDQFGFVDFTVDLVKGVYETIVNASIDQLQTYADLVSQVSKDLATYQADLIGADGSPELTAKIDSYIKDVIDLNPASATDYTLNTEKVDELKIHFNSIFVEDTSTTPPTKKGFPSFLTAAAGGAGGSTLKVVDLKEFVKEKLKASVKNSQDLLKSILKIGMQKVVVTNGEIMTKLTFHFDASQESSKKRNNTNRNSSSWGVGGGISAGTGPVASLLGNAVGGSLSGGYKSRQLSVRVVNEKSSSATNIRVDIIGLVRILFSTETFPTIDV